MKAFIKLTSLAGYHIYMSCLSDIEVIEAIKPGHTVIVLRSRNYSIQVAETPEEIFDLYKKTLAAR